MMLKYLDQTLNSISSVSFIDGIKAFEVDDSLIYFTRDLAL